MVAIKPAPQTQMLKHTTHVDTTTSPHKAQRCFCWVWQQPNGEYPFTQTENDPVPSGTHPHHITKSDLGFISSKRNFLLKWVEWSIILADRLPSRWTCHAAYNHLSSLTTESPFSLAKALKRKTVHIWIHVVQEFRVFERTWNQRFQEKQTKRNIYYKYLLQKHIKITCHELNIFLKLTFKVTLAVEKLLFPF